MIALNMKPLTLRSSRMIVSLAALILAVACHKDGEHVRVKMTNVVGTYQAKSNWGTERLELRADGTYIQTFDSGAPVSRISGSWHLSNEFLKGSVVELSNAVVEYSSDYYSHGELRLNTLRLDGMYRLDGKGYRLGDGVEVEHPHYQQVK